MRHALQNGRQLMEARTLAVMQVRRVGNQLKEIKSEQDASDSQVSPEKLDGALDEVIATMKFLRASWQIGQSQK